MNEATKKMILGWLDMHNGDVEAVAKWMASTLRVGGLKACRAMVVEASAHS